MLRRFGEDSICAQNNVKSSVYRNCRASVLEQFPRLADVIDDILPKRATPTLVKCQNHISLIALHGEALFLRVREGPWFPTLRLLHRYPSMMPRMRVDQGAIKFVLRGSNVMCPGLTSAGGRMEEVPAGAIVQITAEGKESACAIGVMKMSTAEIREKNKDVCIETLHLLGDGLWAMKNLDDA